jgi:sulfur carrier protein
VIVTVNGEEREVATGLSVSDLVGQLGTASRGIAVVVDGTVVPRGEWPAHRLGERAAVEVITAVQGG